MHRNSPPLPRRIATALALVCALATPAAAGVVPADFIEPAPDSAYADHVARFTTDPGFLTVAVAQLPRHDQVPSPQAFLGYVVGAPGRLTYYTEIQAYFEALAEASPRVAVRSMGVSNEGREMIVVFVADEDAINRLDELADMSRRLADARVSDQAAAEALIAGGARPFYYLTGGLHSNETGSPEMLMELAFRLATGESPAVRRIRSGVVTMLTPVLEVDGRERMVDWYYNVTIDHEDWNDMPQRYPPYWGKYTLHDNNRDGLQLTQPLSRNLFDTFFAYHPQVMHDLHESVPLMYVSAGTGPYNEALDPIVTAEWQTISNHEVSELTKLGLSGVWTWGFYTGWWPGYAIWVANNHNSLGRFYETFGNAGASTFERELKGKFAGKKVTSRHWYRPRPPEEKVWWSARNNINYMETGVLVALDYAARNAPSLLYNFWKKGANSLERGRTESPCAWVIPHENRTRYELERLLETLVGQRIEVHRLDEDIEVDGHEFERGDYLVRADQPYRDFAKSLFEAQSFPPEAEFPPYDDVAWTLPMLYGVDVSSVDARALLEHRMSPVSGAERISAEPPGERRSYLIAASASSVTLAARMQLSGFDVRAADTSFAHAGKEYLRGTWLVSGGDDEVKALHEVVTALSLELGLDVTAVKSLPTVPTHALRLPRIAVFHTWRYTQDSGWVRYAFDRVQIPYTLINKDDLRDGGLRDFYDVILVPSTGSWISARDVVHGVDPKWGPLPYRNDNDTRNLGLIDASDDITGGMGLEGLAELERFVHEGGTLITLGAASVVPVEFGLVRHVSRVRPSGFHNPGSVVRARVVDDSHPIVVGYGERPQLFRGNLPLFKLDDTYAHYAVVVYGSKLPGGAEDDEPEGEGEAKDEGPICLSGMVKNESALDGKPAIMDIPVGRGRIVLFSFNPMHRFLNLSNFALVNNAILNWDHSR